MQSIRGVIIVLLTKLGLPLDIARAIYALRYTDYETLQWHVMGLHYRAGAVHHYIAARPWRFTGRTQYVYHDAGGTTAVNSLRLRQLLQMYVESHADAQLGGEDDLGYSWPAYYAELGLPFAEALIYEYVGNDIYFRAYTAHLRTQAQLDSLCTLTPDMIGEIRYDLISEMELLINAWALCGVTIAIPPTVPHEYYILGDGWTFDMLVERVHAIWMATRPADR